MAYTVPALAKLYPYILTTGKGHDHTYDVYIITNTETGIIEYETRLLPQAHSILKQLASTLFEQTLEPKE